MSTYTGESNDYPSAASLIGNVDVPHNTNPIVRSSQRRLDADGVSSAPYYASVSGKILSLVYTYEVATVVTSASDTITFTGNTMAQIIADINAMDPDNIEGLDLGGFIAIRNRNPGKTHVLFVEPYVTPANDAAPYLGLAVYPYAGARSYAGELASTPGCRTQENPPSTTLIAKDEDLTSSSFNRALTSSIQFTERLRLQQTQDKIVYQDVSLTFANHPVTPSKRVARINESRRLYIPVDTGSLELYFQVLTTTFAQAIKSDYTVPKITQIYYATAATALVATPFSAWGTPDGGSVIDATVINKDKHAATAVTSIENNIVYCAGATFTTKKVTQGDYVYLTASNLQPFDHTGWFMVDALIDDTHIAIRSVADSEDPPTVAQRPRQMNSVGGGTLRVAVGRYIWANDLWLEVDDTTMTTAIIRMPIACPRFFDVEDINYSGGLDVLSGLLGSHVNDTSGAHAASAITGFTSATLWNDGTAPTGGTLKQTIEDVITDLASETISESGSLRVGAEAISIGGASPNTVAAGSINSQLISLLTTLRDHVVQAAGAHAASAVTYAGGGTWADTATNPATTVELQLDKIITDLAGVGIDGAVKIRALLDGILPAGTVRSQLSHIATNFFINAGANPVSGQNVYTNDQFGDNMSWRLGDNNTLTKAMIRTTETITSGQRLLAWEFGLGSGTAPHLRIYINSSYDLEFVWNAKWSTVGTDFWLCDDSTQHAIRLVIGSEVHIQYKSATASFFGDAFFTTTGNFFDYDLVSNTLTILSKVAYKHATRTMEIPMSAGSPATSSIVYTFSSGGSSLDFVTTAMNWVLPIALPIGKRIIEVRVRVQDSATGPNSIVANLYSFNGSGGNTLIDSVISNESGTAQTLTMPALTATVAANVSYGINFISAGATGTTKLFGVEVDYDELP